MMVKSYDVVIVGSGIVGASLACALANSTNLTIAVLDAKALPEYVKANHYQPRVSAITLASKQLFSAMNVWDDIAKQRLSEFTQINVWDEAGGGEINFTAEEIGEECLGYIIENDLIQSCLIQRMQQLSQIDVLAPIKLEKLIANDNGFTIAAENQQLQATLLVAADGANSWVRSQMNIGITQYAYDQKALVATIESELSHQQTAQQVFLSTGPLAFLPLEDKHFSSIVWSLPTTEAEFLMTLSADDFAKKLSLQFKHRLGHLKVGERFTFPLIKQETEKYVKPHLALVGDAAHVIHPLAGQGVNMGLLDANSLAKVVLEALDNKRNFSSLATLRKYERWRRADNYLLIKGVHFLKDIFASDKKALQNLRSIGLNAINELPWIKNIFTRYALGERGR